MCRTGEAFPKIRLKLVSQFQEQQLMRLISGDVGKREPDLIRTRQTGRHDRLTTS
jgi:hypothetical protein